MIFASTLVLALAVSSVPAAVGAPIGNRDFDVRAMRRALASNNAALAARAVPEHHSARSYVAGGGNDPRSANAGTANVNKREANPESTGTWRRERAKDNIPRYVRDAIPKKRAAEVKVETREEKVEARHPGHGHGPGPHGHPHGKPEGSTDDGTTNPDDSQSTPESREVKVEARHPGHPHGPHGPHGHPHGKPEGSSDDGTSNPDDSQSSPESREVKVETRHPGHGHGHGPHGGPPGGGKGPSSSDDTTNPDDSQSSPESREVKVVKRVNWFGKYDPNTTGETTGRREVQGDSHQQQRRGPLGVIASFKRTLESLD